MKILFTRFPLESVLGGAEIQTLSLMEGLVERGHEVSFAGSCPVLLSECRKRDMAVTEIDIGKPPVTKSGVISFIWRKHSMRKKLKTMLENYEKIQKPDVLVMLSLSEKLLLTDLAADTGIKVVWVEHDRIGRWLTKNPWLPLLLKQSRKAMTIAVSELSRKMYVELGWSEKNVIAIVNGVVSKKFSILNSQFSIPFRLGCIARLSREKGVDVLINAMVDVSETITLEIIGTGREEPSLKNLTKKLRLEKRITFTALESNVALAYQRFDAFMLPSRDNDPFGMVAAEAMMAGLPVIMTDACGIAGYVENGKDALIVQADSSSALVDAVKRIQNSEFRIQIAKRGQKTAREKFSTKTMVNRYEDVFTRNDSNA